MYKKDNGSTRRLGACSAQHFICSANARHSSTSLSPYRILYQRDPVLPLQFMDWVNHRGLNSASECFNLLSSDDSEDNDYIS